MSGPENADVLSSSGERSLRNAAVPSAALAGLALVAATPTFALLTAFYDELTSGTNDQWLGRLGLPISLGLIASSLDL